MTSKEHTDNLNALFEARKKTRQADIHADDEFIKAARLILRELVMSETARAEAVAEVEKLKLTLQQTLSDTHKRNHELMYVMQEDYKQAIAKLQIENDALKKQIAAMETHPDVIAAKETKATEQKAKRVAELEAAAKRAADELAKLKA